ncbi:tumor necrosis factor receptor superfamily member 1A [Anguilla rostrata]|uniref:tumor necrosis factor receptor superfamily member 1A n=1 Tax=Anguilla rostrata TaxID=7938 RepID=UPI0030D50BFA
MDRAQHRGKWKKKCCFTLFFSICLDVCAAAAVPASCKGDEFRSSKGHCCNRCPPGFFMVEECEGPRLRTNCSVCPSGRYIETTNYVKQCFRCRTCKPENYEKESSRCEPAKNTVCECQDGYAKIYIDRNTWDCIAQEVTSCLPPKDVEEPSYHWSFFVGVALVAVIAVVLLVFGIYKVLKRFKSGVRESPGLLEPAPAESSTEKLLISSIPKTDSSIQESTPVFSVFPGNRTPDLPPQLPDCIPQEFKFSPFVYYLLDLVPADRFKELVRHLGVLERDIERAERDNRTFKESQHQMLRVWGERGGGGVKGILPLPVVLELLSTLRMMGLGGCAEAIEEKYGIQ